MKKSWPYTVNMQGGGEPIADYVARMFTMMTDNFKAGKQPGVTDDATGAHSAAAYIFVQLKRNPSLINEAVPPSAQAIEDMINNPGNPLTWVTQKLTRGANAAINTVEQNLDKPAAFLQEVNPFAAGNSLDYRKLAMYGAVAGALYFLGPMILAATLKRKRTFKRIKD